MWVGQKFDRYNFSKNFANFPDLGILMVLREIHNFDPAVD
jgi:hypothetical protein